MQHFKAKSKLYTRLADNAVVRRLVPRPRLQHRLLPGRRQRLLHPLALLQRPQQAVPATGTRRVSATVEKEKKKRVRNTQKGALRLT